MLRNRWWIGSFVVLQACAEPAFEFRGYTDLSSCASVIDAELASGAEYVDVFAAEDPESPAQTVELTGTLFSEPVDVGVTCTAGRIDSVQYVSQASDPMETGAIFARFAAELEALFGEPAVVLSDDARSLRFLCRNPSPVVLEEWRVDAGEEPESGQEAAEHEVYVAVIPEAAACLDTTGG